MITKAFDHCMLGIFVLTMSLLGSSSFLGAQTALAAPTSESSDLGQAALININQAGLEELQAIRGVGPVTAERIIQYRDANGPFETLDDIAGVQGIGGVKLQKIKEQVSV